jgi:hypothetical protein
MSRVALATFGARTGAVTRLSVLPALLVAAACGGGRVHEAKSPLAGELGPQPVDMAQVCVVRPASFAAATTMTVHDNGRLVGATRGRTYVCWLAAPGAHQITSEDDDTGPTLFRADAGARYWLHQEVFEVGGLAHAHLDWVDEDYATELLDACDTRVRVSVPGHDDHPSAQPIVPATRM